MPVSDWKAYSRARYKRHRESGLCGQCSRPAVEGRTLCRQCKESTTRRGRKYYARLRGLGLCCNCKVNRVKKGTWCESCKSVKATQRIAVRKVVFNHYGLRCACCGEDDFLALTIDHIRNNGAAHRRALRPEGSRFSGGQTFYLWLIKHGLPVGYQTLCFNCNCIKSFHNKGRSPAWRRGKYKHLLNEV